MRALPPVSCINYNRPGYTATKQSTVFSVTYSAVKYTIEQCSNVQFNTVQYSAMQCSVSVSCIHYSGSRSAIMIYSPSHPHTTHNMPTHTCILLRVIRVYGYTCVCVCVEIRVYNEYNLHLAKSYIYSFSATHQHQYHYLSPLIGHVTS